VSQLLPQRHLHHHLVQFLLVPRPHGGQDAMRWAFVSSKLLAICTRHGDIGHLSLPALSPPPTDFSKYMSQNQVHLKSSYGVGWGFRRMGCGGSKVSQWSGFQVLSLCDRSRMNPRYNGIQCMGTYIWPWQGPACSKLAQSARHNALSFYFVFFRRMGWWS
jgi:hypothetical protein